jgi:hypothetical protein
MRPSNAQPWFCGAASCRRTLQLTVQLLA